MNLAITVAALFGGLLAAWGNARAYGRRVARRAEAERQELREINIWINLIKETE